MISNQVKTKHLLFRNRLVMPPMATAKADEAGHITEDILNYYIDKTKHNLYSAVIVEHSYVDKRGKAHARQMSIADDSDIYNMRKLAKVIKDSGAIAILQISHAGSASTKEIIGMQPVAPSAILNPAKKSNSEMPEELSWEAIQNIKEKFIAAARRAKKAGFDAVELHSAHGYLLNQFLSPLSNKRHDEYGGSIEGRIKLHLEIIDGIQQVLGKDYPILLRMGAGDFRDGGLSEQDAIVAAKAFEASGVEVLDISGGMSFYSIGDTRPGYFDVIAKPIFEAVSVPVILTGGIKSGKDAQEVLERNVCDLIGVGRAVLADSHWVERELGNLLGA